MKNTIFIISFLVANTIAFAQNHKPEIAKGVTVYHDLFNTSMNSEVSCYRIPAIVTAQNGDLVVAIDERVPSCGDLKWSRDINNVIRRSSDNGKTWSAIEKIVDFPTGKSASDPSMIVDEVTDEIFLFYNPGCNATIIRYTSTEDGYEKNRLLFSNAKMVKGREKMTVRISYDEGLTWTEGKTIYPGASAYSSHTVLKNGDIGLFFEKDDYKENAFVSFSLQWLTDNKASYK